MPLATSPKKLTVNRQFRLSQKEEDAVESLMAEGNLNFAELMREAIALVEQVQIMQRGGFRHFIAENIESDERKTLTVRLFANQE